VERDQLADEQCRERLARPPTRPEDPLFGADVADGDSARWDAAELGEKLRVRLRVGDDEVGGAERTPVDRREQPRGDRTRPEAAAVADERVGERDERVEDDRPLAGDAARRREVEVARVADDDDVEAFPRRA
jgi:hypothetical protein